MKDLKTGFRMIRYAYGIKSNCVQAAAFALSGIVLIVLGEGRNFWMLGGFFWICIGILPTQLIHSLSVSNLVQASPMKRKMQTIVPVMASLACMLLAYLLNIVICGILSRVRGEQAAGMGTNLVQLSIMIVIVMAYLGICYKHFLLATLCFVPGMVLWLQGGVMGWTSTWLFLSEMDIPFGLAVPMGLGIILAGGLLEYLLTLLLYKAPLSKMAQSVPLRKEL